VRITVIGCGYLGATHAAGMAEMGHEVLGVELDPVKLAALRKGEPPFHEPRLGDLLGEHVRSGRLRFTDEIAEAGRFGELHFLCVGTPQMARSNAADVSQVFAAVDALSPHLRDTPLVVGKSTVPVGTAEQLAVRLGDRAMLAWNPEFLREGFAVQDTLEPDRLVFGVGSVEAADALRDVYASVIGRGTPVITTDYATAELVKVAANAFLATKISFINAISEICEATGADVIDLADAIGHDARIGRRFLNAGIGFGGGCLPKDIRGFLHRAGELGVEDAVGFLHQIDEINTRQRAHAVAAALDMLGGSPEGRQVAVWGAAFKPDSDDVRDSPALVIAGQLHLAGARVRVYDPAAAETARRLYPTLQYADSALEAAEGADLLLHLTEWQEFRELDPLVVRDVVATPRLLDGRNALDLRRWRSAGWQARGMGHRG
jgi:UDPglucose 6-dehydrogenase